MNGIEKELKGNARVIRINLNTSFGRTIAKRLDVKSTKTMIVFDANGKEISRHLGRPNKAKIVEAATGGLN